jgi:AcrR family transcriptional regulator
VLRAAIRIADDGGLATLSMRRLGQELDVEAMSLYNHVANKEDLLDAITDEILAEIELPSGDHWKADLRRHAISAHDVFGRHPWACNLTISRPLPLGVRRAEWILRRLREAGLPPEVAYHAYHALDSHILSFTLWEVGHSITDETDLAELAGAFFRRFPPDDYPFMYEHAQQHLDGFGRGQPGAFELVLDLILDGFERMRDLRRGA